MAQLVRNLWHSMKTGLLAPYEKPGMATAFITSALGGVKERKRGIPGGHWLASLVDSSRAGKTPALTSGLHTQLQARTNSI